MTAATRFGLDRNDYEALFVKPFAKRLTGSGLTKIEDPYPKTTQEVLTELADRGYECTFRQLIYLIDPIRSGGAITGPTKTKRDYLWSRENVDAIADHLEEVRHRTLEGYLRSFLHIHPRQDIEAMRRCQERTDIDDTERLVMVKLPRDKSGYAQSLYFSPEEVQGFIDFVSEQPAKAKARR